MPIVRAVLVGIIIGLLIERLILKIRGKRFPTGKQSRRPQISHLFLAWLVLFAITKVIDYLK